jgi:hypothetical protein
MLYAPIFANPILSPSTSPVSNLSLTDCDNVLRNGGGLAPDGSVQCNMACAGNGAEICGGPNRLDMFQYTSWGFLGCFTDVVAARSLGLRVPVSTIPPASMTVEKCQGACSALGYSLAGVEYSQECCEFLPYPFAARSPV